MEQIPRPSWTETLQQFRQALCGSSVWGGLNISSPCWDVREVISPCSCWRVENICVWGERMQSTAAVPLYFLLSVSREWVTAQSTGESSAFQKAPSRKLLKTLNADLSVASTARCLFETYTSTHKHAERHHSQNNSRHGDRQSQLSRSQMSRCPLYESINVLGWPWRVSFFI